ncbi:MAG: hypothetical protein RIS79_321 [Verrucomicrobiota bacterium]|jgi:predicted AAA+ superfamily ATPase
MLLRETLLSVLQQPAVPAVELRRHRQPVWERNQWQSHALVLTGGRRCGKSTLQGQIRQTAKGKALTLNLEGTRLDELGPEDFARLFALLDEHHLDASIYLDEVQEVPDWQCLVRSLLDKGRRVCLAASNASLLGRELGSKLPGRHLSHEVYPLSYREFLEFTARQPGAASLQDDLARAAVLPRSSQKLNKALFCLATYYGTWCSATSCPVMPLRALQPLMTIMLHLLAHTSQPLSLQALPKDSPCTPWRKRAA